MSWYNPFSWTGSNSAPEGMIEFPEGSGNYIKKPDEGFELGKAIGPWKDFVPAPEFDLGESLKRNTSGVFDGIGDLLKIAVAGLGLLLLLKIIKR